jgi:3-oxoacyl-[acyl-carrier protein] reductase
MFAARRCFRVELVQSLMTSIAVLPVGCNVDALIPARLIDTDERSWEQRCEAVVREALHSAQEAFTSFDGGGGRIIFVMPSVSLVGAAGLVPLATALEGVRALAKSAARQWADHGITVNCVVGDLELRDEIAGVVDLLASEAGGAITGQTIVVDGGSVMLP